jgi:glutamine amidotransferase
MWYKFAAYLGPDLQLDQFLLEPGYSLLNQSLQPEKPGYSDAFGIGWYAADGRPAVYAERLPPASDPNLPHLARSLSAPLWLAALHDVATPFAATLPLQPRHDARLLFLYPGFIEDFKSLRPTLREFLQTEPAMEPASTAAGDHLFALVQHLLRDDPTPDVLQALSTLFALLSGWLGPRRALLNLIIADGERLYATRHAHHLECSPLYYTVDDETFPEGQLLASTRLTDAEFWQPLPADHLLVLDATQPPELVTLPL